MLRRFYAGKRMAPQVGLEPTTLRLTAGCSAIELLRSVGGGAPGGRDPFIVDIHNIIRGGVVGLAKLRSSLFLFVLILVASTC